MACCRVCLKLYDDMYSLYQHNDSTPKILYRDMLSECTNIQVLEGDELPDRICIACKQVLEQLFEFKKLAESSNNILMNKFSHGKRLVFGNLNELRQKIDIKIPIRRQDEFERSLPLEIILNGGVINNTVISKVQGDRYFSDDNFSEDDMKVEYLDEDLFEYTIPPKSPKKKKGRRSKNETVIATIKGLDTFMNDEKFTKKFPPNKAIPIKERQNNYTYPKAKTVKKTYTIKQKNCDTNETLSYTMTQEEKLSTADPKRKEKHICPVCGLLTYGLQTHMITHQETKPFACDQCNKTFSQKTNYTMHMKKHTGVKDQICEICGAAFYFWKSVVRHKLIHKGDRPFKCHLCPRRFIANCDLTRHLKVHAGYKPFKCNDCTMMFNAKHQLMNHIRMHTGEKPFSCQVCNVAFTYKVNLNNHVFKVHGINLKFKSIYTITPEVLSELYQLNGDNVGKSLPVLVEPV